MDLVKLSKTISHALRHEPWLYELELDSEGWTDLEALLGALREELKHWIALTAEDVHEAIKTSQKQRFEVSRGRIRALYGHSVPGKIIRTPTTPPAELFHGNAPATLNKIRKSGLLPMARRFVHLSSDRATAAAVGRRKSHEPIVLVIRATEASAAGVFLYDGNDKTWLADRAPMDYIDVP